jgi:hypothetical protein
VVPQAGAPGHDVGLVLVPGIGIDSKAYLPLLDSLRRAAVAADLRLFAGCAHFEWGTPCTLSELTVPKDLSSRIDKVVWAMQARGLQAGSPVFHGAHSLSTAFLQDCLAQGRQTSGQILMGGCLLRKHCYPMFSYKVPTLTVCGDMDGTEPIMRQAEQHKIQSSLDQTQFPVVVMEGQTHMQFASGPAPRDLKEEMPPFVTDEAAHTATAELLVDFMRARLGLPGAGDVLAARLRSTQAHLMPLFMSLGMDQHVGGGAPTGPTDLFTR